MLNVLSSTKNKYQGREIPQILVYCDNKLDKMTDDEDDDEFTHILQMIYLSKRINTVLQQDDGTDVEFINNVLDQLLFNDDDK